MTKPAHQPLTFGEFVRARRQLIGLRLKDVADALGVSLAYMSEVERALRPPFRNPRHLLELARVLAVLPEDLDAHRGPCPRCGGTGRA